MLVHRGTGPDPEADIDSIHNYYEHLVLERIQDFVEKGQVKPEVVADIACVALNRLPPRYIRYDVDMAFYLSPKEYHEIEEKVDSAVNQAINFVSQRDRRAG